MSAAPATSLPVEIATARACALGKRLTPAWQDEATLLAGLVSANVQFFIVTRSGLAQRRRIRVRWQLRLSP